MVMKVFGALRWKLKYVMDRRQIGAAQLAEFLKVTPNMVSKWRQAKYMPQITEKRYVQIVAAINHLCDVNGVPDKKIELWGLIEFCASEQRDFDVRDYEYQPGSARKKSKVSDNLDSPEPKKPLEQSVAA